MAFSVQSRQAIDLLPPYKVIEGVLWSGFLGYSVWRLTSSLPALCTALKVKSPTSEKCAKIAGATKTAFLDLLSLGSSSSYMTLWADGARVIAFGKRLPFVQRLYFGTTLLSSGIESGAEVYNIWTHRQAMAGAITPVEREKNKQGLRLALLNLIGNVSMVAWAALGLLGCAGFVVNPVLSPLCLGASLLFLGAGFLYKFHLARKTVSVV